VGLASALATKVAPGVSNPMVPKDSTVLMYQRFQQLKGSYCSNPGSNGSNGLNSSNSYNGSLVSTQASMGTKASTAQTTVSVPVTVPESHVCSLPVLASEVSKASNVKPIS
jgi:hypothetical protein